MFATDIVSYRENSPDFETGRPVLQRVRAEEIDRYQNFIAIKNSLNGIDSLVTNYYRTKKDNPSIEETRSALEVKLAEYLHHAFNANSFYLHLNNFPALNFRHNLSLAELPENTIVKINKTLAREYSGIYHLYQTKGINLQGLQIIPLEQHEPPAILGFIALKSGAFNYQMKNSAYLLQTKLIKILRLIFEVP